MQGKSQKNDEVKKDFIKLWAIRGKPESLNSRGRVGREGEEEEEEGEEERVQ